MTVQPTVERTADVRLALRLTYLTLGWMTIEGAASLWLGAHAHSLLLEGFGADSVIEMISAGVLLWRLGAEASGRAGGLKIEAVERRAATLVGYTLYVLAALVAANSFVGIFVIHNRADTHESVWGILIGLAAKIGMPILAGWKLKVAARLQSKALRVDAMEAITCGYLSVVLMIGLAVTGLFPSLWWLDSAAALVLVPFLVKEGREAVTGECCCEE